MTWRSTLPAFERLDGVNVYRFEAIERGPRTWRVLNEGLSGYWRAKSSWYTPHIIWGNGPNSPRMLWWMLRHGRSYDLIHTNSLHYATVPYTHWVARRLGVPYAVTPFIHIDQPSLFDINFQNDILRNADLVFAMTDREKDYLAARGVDPRRVTVTGLGIQLDEYPRQDPGECRRQLGLPTDAFVLLFLARKEKYKGLELLLQAHARLSGECPNLYLVAAGPETADSQLLRSRYADLQQVIYFDAVPNDVKLALLNSCDVFGMLSVGESFGIVYLEAWAMGKAVIGAKSGAIPSLISDGVDGLLAMPDDPDDVAEKIAQLYHDVRKCRRLGQMGYAKLSARYTVGKVADMIEGAYSRAVRAYHNRQNHNGYKTRHRPS
jgi:glycosyltransferase involved in cell wall biosynthesis